MGKNILLLTTIYPAPDLNLLNNTNVCHYFAKEWVKMGYNVKVVFNYPIYSPIFHLMANLMENKLASNGSAYITTKRIIKDFEYEMDGVKIVRFPLYKFMPKIAVEKSVVNKQIEKIISSNKKDSFTPDIIIAHFFYPHLEMVYRLAKEYSAKSCITVHEQSINLNRIYGDKLQILLDSINIWGYRSLPLKRNFENKYIIKSPSFQCYSGIPESYLIKDIKKKVTAPIKRFVYVGSFIKRKNPHKVADALCNLPYNDWHIDYVGVGDLVNATKRIFQKHKKVNNVTFWGHIDRNRVQEILTNAECFIMISAKETFGLVYLEAMAKGLITIASKNEGMDGVIINGTNGFLCNAGDPFALKNIIDKINNMTNDELTDISRNAIKTAMSLTDKKVAATYIHAVENVDS